MSRKMLLAALSATAMAVSGIAQAQVAGHADIGVSVTELQAVYAGWSVKKAILGKPVFNDAGEKIGNVRDLIITPEKAVSFAVIGVGGFLGVARHDVAVPVERFTADNNRIVLPGATRDALKSIPSFEYAKVKASTPAQPAPGGGS
jgi:sporulation protein YlmC with PRC-barrel domain